MDNKKIFAMVSICLITIFATVAQAAVIDSVVTPGLSVYGNSTAPNYTTEPTVDNATENIVTLETGASVTSTIAIGGDVVGGYVMGGIASSTSNTATATNNSIVMNGGIAEDLIGGIAITNNDIATARSNSITINGGTVDGIGLGDIIGGISFTDSGTATATNNSIIINDASIRDIYYISGGYAVVGDENSSGDVTATNNTTTINAGTIKGGYIFGGLSESDGDNSAIASSNRIDINGGSIEALIIGGGGGGDGVNVADYNIVNIYGGTVKKTIIGGDVRGGVTNTASHNIVNIYGGTFEGVDIVGGHSNSIAGNTLNNTASYNTVNISGGTIKGTIDTHAYILGGCTAIKYDAVNKAENNTVTIEGSPTFTYTEIWGGERGNLISWADVDAFNGNTLNVHSYTGTSTIKAIGNFENYNFVLSNSIQNGDTVLKVETITFNNGGTGANLKSSTVTGVSVDMAGGTPPLKVGDTVTLIDATVAMNGTITNDGQVIKGQQGIAFTYDWELEQTNGVTGTGVGQLRATVVGENEAQLTPQTKALSESVLGSVTLINQATDMVAGQGMSSAQSATSSVAGNSMITVPFGSMSSGTSRYNTGSHVDISSLSLMAGIALGNEVSFGKIFAGAFFESGWGSYNTYNSFNIGDIEGDGNTDYYGGGVLGRLDINLGKGMIYTEASARLGSVSSDFSSSDLRDPVTGQTANYDTRANYYGFHLGVGYIWDITEKINFDIHTKYFYTHQEKIDVNILNDPYKFDAVNSHRIRTGGRLGYDFNTKNGLFFTSYAGIAYEYEFDSEVNGTIYGNKIEAPSLQGSTGVGEVGLRFLPSEESSFSIDFGIQGYVGMREGVSGSLQMMYKF